ncbi:MAG: glycoside hydrolase family 27 protein [Alphaproteobacteria bacterium]|nr:glycoside hydrolase family 27 protein [Alphaproteobacteria bacterium]
MRKTIGFALLLSASLAAALAQTPPTVLAPTPPMGWNSWDAYGLTINEADYKANAAVLADLKPYGWTYAVIDEGWYMADPFGAKLADRKYQIDDNGLLEPDVTRFPLSANGAGLKPLADWVHDHGLKFGIHVVRGIPKEAVERNTPIAGSGFHAADAADTSDLCPWDDGNYGVRDNAAGQAYYDSMVKLYADWGVDYIKVDCIADHPYKPTEIRQIAQAIQKSNRPIVLSLSPGPTQLSHAEEVGRYAQLWRIADDTWDGWSFAPDKWPNGVRTAFDMLAQWHTYAKPGNWPDADMLPFGSLTPHPGWGEPRQSRLTPDEERTMFTLWAIARSPLILGGDLTRLDDVTRALITNKDVIAVNQTTWESHPVGRLPKSLARARVWMALSGSRKKPVHTVALFNLADRAATLRATWGQLGLPGAHKIRDLWNGRRKPASDAVTVRLPAHGSVIYRVE